METIVTILILIGMAWVIPTTGALILAVFVFKENSEELQQTA